MFNYYAVMKIRIDVRFLPLFSLLVFTFQFAFSQMHCMSKGTGDWDTMFVCTGSGTPIIYEVESGDTITLGSNVISNLDTLNIEGVLQFIGGRKLELDSSAYVNVNSGAKVTGGTSGSGFRFSGGTTVPGSFNVTGRAYAQNGMTTFKAPTLPVGWLNVEAEMLSNNTLSVQWSTASEFNNEMFVIEMAGEDMEFKELGRINSLAVGGNSQEILDYNAELTLPYEDASAQTLYIRIKQVDFDGHFDFSQVIVHNRDFQAEYLLVFKENIEVHLAVPSRGTVFLYGLSGEKLVQMEYSGNMIQIPMVNPGAYVLMIHTSNLNIEPKRIVISPRP